MQSCFLRRSVVTAVALAASGLSASAAGTGAAPLAESLLPPSSKGGGQAGFWGPLQAAEVGYSWHKISIQPSLSYRAFYTDSLFQYQQGAPKTDFVHYVSPKLLLAREVYPGNWEVQISAGYTPTFVVHSLNGEFDRTLHLARAHVSAVRDEHVIGIDQTYTKGSESSSEVGFLVQQENYQTRLSYEQPLSGRFSLATSAFRRYIDSSATAVTSGRTLESWTGDGFVLYDWLPKVSSGLGASVNYLDQAGLQGDFQALLERVLTRWRLQAFGKIQMSLDAGLQFGQSLTKGGADFAPTPVATGSVQYSPRYGTVFSLSLDRTAGLSSLSALKYTENRASLTVRQRVYQTMSASLTAGYGHGSYGSALTGGAVRSRNYDYYTAGFNYTWTINEHMSLTGFYQYLRRQSDLSFDTYANNQVGFVVNVAL